MSQVRAPPLDDGNKGCEIGWLAVFATSHDGKNLL